MKMRRGGTRDGRRRPLATVFAGGLFLVAAAAAAEDPLFNDSHFHLTNYVQQGPPLRDFLERSMSTKAGRVALFGIPLQQTWSYENSGDYAPTYYLQTDAPAKSGVGGGIIAVSPGKFGIAAFSPPLDAAGNSVRPRRRSPDVSNALGGNPYLVKPR